MEQYEQELVKKRPEKNYSDLDIISEGMLKTVKKPEPKPTPKPPSHFDQMEKDYVGSFQDFEHAMFELIEVLEPVINKYLNDNIKNDPQGVLTSGSRLEQFFGESIDKMNTTTKRIKDLTKQISL